MRRVFYNIRLVEFCYSQFAKITLFTFFYTKICIYQKKAVSLHRI